nr:MAG TPA: hypothetical protein [Caudoviricetes sp.]
MNNFYTFGITTNQNSSLSVGRIFILLHSLRSRFYFLLIFYH